MSGKRSIDPQPAAAHRAARHWGLWIGSSVVLLLLLPMTAVAAAIGLGSDDLRLAYIDPGAGSFVVQALVAALAGIAVTARIYWSKIKNMLGFATSDEDDEDSHLGDE